MILEKIFERFNYVEYYVFLAKQSHIQLND